MERHPLAAVRGRCRFEIVLFPGQMLAAFLRQNTATRVVLVHQSGSNQKRFRDAREGLCGHTEGRSKQIETPSSPFVIKQLQVFLFERPEPERVQLFEPACMSEMLHSGEGLALRPRHPSGRLEQSQSQSRRASGPPRNERRNLLVDVPAESS